MGPTKNENEDRERKLDRDHEREPQPQRRVIQPNRLQMRLRALRVGTGGGR